MSAPGIAAPDRWGDRLPRRLGLWSAVAVLVGSTIGSGIFRTPARIAAYVPAPGPMFGVWVLGGLLALCGALTYAELAALYPRSGGVYVYIREGFGRLPAFLFGWTELLLIRASALGAIATPFAEYLLRSLGYDPKIEPNATYVHYVAAGAIVLTATLNYVGVRWSSLILNLTTGAKYGALVLLVLLAFVVGQGDFGHFTQVGGAVRPGFFGLALVSVLWAYDGWGDLSFVGGEVRDPERNMPRALILGTLSVIAIYLLVNAAYLYLIPIAQMGHSPLVAADVAQLIVGQVGVGLVAVLGLLATFSKLLGSILPFCALAGAAVFALRRRQPERPRPVKVLGYPIVPLLFILATFIILGNALREHPGPTGLAFGGILLGVPAYFAWLRWRPRAENP